MMHATDKQKSFSRRSNTSALLSIYLCLEVIKCSTLPSALKKILILKNHHQLTFKIVVWYKHRTMLLFVSADRCDLKESCKNAWCMLETSRIFFTPFKHKFHANWISLFGSHQMLLLIFPSENSTKVEKSANIKCVQTEFFRTKYWSYEHNFFSWLLKYLLGHQKNSQIEILMFFSFFGPCWSQVVNKMLSTDVHVLDRRTRYVLYHFTSLPQNLIYLSQSWGKNNFLKNFQKFEL